MAFTKIIAPNGVWNSLLATGAPNAAGKIYTYEAGTNVPKTTYADPAGEEENTNPVTLDAAGTAFMYFSTDTLYKIIETDSEGDLDNPIRTYDNYPNTTNEDSSLVVSPITHNLIRNPQFTFWRNGTQFSTISASNSGADDFIADDWQYSRSDSTMVVNINQGTLDLDQTEIAGFPANYLNYVCSNAGLGTDTQNGVYQKYNNVQTFAGQTIVFGFYGFTLASSIQVSISFQQYFGTGGSPSSSVFSTPINFTLTSAKQLLTASLTLASLTGKTLGTNGDDSLIMHVYFQAVTTTGAGITSVQLFQGNSLGDSGFNDYLSQNDQYMRLYENKYAMFQTGDFKPTLRATADPGWVLCNDGTIGSPTSGATSPNASFRSQALYILIWNSVSDTYAPVTGGRGASGQADFNLNKKIALTKALGRALAIAGSGSGLSTWALGQTTGAETHSISIAEMPAHAHPGSTVLLQGEESGGVHGSITFDSATGTSHSESFNLSISSQGSGTAMSLIPPETFVNVMIKL